MSQNYYKLYIDSVISLASTIVIKSDLSADFINKSIKLQYGEGAVDLNDKTTWKYYLNICGYYHSTDSVITITSLDSGEEITFDKETLEDHPFTKESYGYGTRFYRELVTTHPDKELIIIGSLYPAVMANAITAKDGSVLAYPKNLIEENELSLISNIEDWILKYKIRWDNSQFNVSDSLYGASSLGVMYLNLVPLILNLRLQACKTNEVHSFHVRQYLASHGMLDLYLDQLNLKQALFLYRNINYIERNNGKREIFTWLIEKLLTDRNIPIAEYSMRHNVTNIETNLKPSISFKKKDVNSVYSGTNSSALRITLDQLLKKEEPDAVQNSDYILFEKDRINKQFEHSLSSVVGSKVLESSMVDYSSSDPYPLVEIQLNHWLYFALNKIYTANITFSEPRTDLEINLDALDAFIYWFYIYCKSVGVEFPKRSFLDQSPLTSVSFNRVVIPQRITRNDFLQIAQLDFVSEEYINEVILSQVGITSMNTVQTFNRMCDTISEARKYQQSLISAQEHQYGRAVLEKCVRRLYMDGSIDLRTVFSANGSSALDFDTWLNEKNIINHNYSKEECEIIYSSIFSKATGGTLYTTKAMSDLQKSMISLMKQLSSYSIQFVTEINKSNILNLNWAAIRVGDIFSSESEITEAVMTAIMPSSVISDESNSTPVDISNSNLRAVTSTVTSDTQELLINTKPMIGLDLGTLHTHEMRIGTISINPCIYNDPNFVGGIKVLESYQSFNALTPTEQLTIKDIYYDVFVKDPSEGKIRLSGIILRDVIRDFNYTDLAKNTLKAFNYFFIPKTIESGIKNLLTVELDALYSNLGKEELPGFRLMNRESIASLFKYLGKTTVLNTFVNMSGNVLADINSMNEMLGYGVTLNLFSGLTPVITLDGFEYSQDSSDVNFTYSTDRYSINFVRPFFGSSVAMQPVVSSNIVNAFKLVNSSSVVSGFTFTGYNLTGFSYNGTQLDFN